MNEYSVVEQKLIAAISPHWYDVITKTDITPSFLYIRLAEECFIEDRQGPEVYALRRVCRAMRDCKPYRLTPEFDKLASF